ncbi:MAG: helix-turn-helix transcriptional regulator [Clostridiales Family XIII bacterium]|jgi:transcriptional regulator with XRE-family HTH domain|nr:helix-turn-helix transcriptional regulator [Clostridiales Family XIII bacterium]
MNINDLLKRKQLSKYRLSKLSGVSFTTVSEITTGKTKIKNCTGENLYRIAKALDVTIEDLLADSMEYRQHFDTFKSNVCHVVKDMGDIDFIIDQLETDKIRNLYQRGWYPESLYLLAMVDYLSRENDLPLCNEYDDIRAARLSEPVYPSSVIAMSAFARNEQPKKDSYAKAIPEFKRFNIVESEVRNVY